MVVGKTAIEKLVVEKALVEEDANRRNDCR
jgi:hypothetical protein